MRAAALAITAAATEAKAMVAVAARAAVTPRAAVLTADRETSNQIKPAARECCGRFSFGANMRQSPLPKESAS
jgi:hypothetical protein